MSERSQKHAPNPRGAMIPQRVSGEVTFGPPMHFPLGASISRLQVGEPDPHWLFGGEPGKSRGPFQTSGPGGVGTARNARTLEAEALTLEPADRRPWREPKSFYVNSIGVKARTTILHR